MQPQAISYGPRSPIRPLAAAIMSLLLVLSGTPFLPGVALVARAAVECGADCYVAPAPAGDDTNGTGLAGAPFATVQKGIASVAAGGTVHIAAGTYTQNLTISKRIALVGAGSGTTTIASAGAANTPVVLVTALPAFDPATPRRLVFEGLTITGATGSVNGNAASGIQVSPAFDGYLTLRDVTATGNAGMGLVINTYAPYADILVEDSDLSGNGIGMKLGSGDQVTGLTIRRSHFDDNGFIGLYRDASDTGFVADVAIADSTFSGNAGRGVSIAKGLRDLAMARVTADFSAVGIESTYLQGSPLKRTARGISIDLAARTGQVTIEDVTVVGNDLTASAVDSLGRGVDIVGVKLDGLTLTAGDVLIRGIDVRGVPIALKGTGANAGKTVDLGDLVVEHAVLGRAVADTVSLDFTTGLGVTQGVPTLRQLAVPAVLNWVHATQLDATALWWGQASGPAAGQVLGTVATDGWIAAYATDPADARTGFWPTSVTYAIPADATSVAVVDDERGSPTIAFAAPAAAGATVEVATATSPEDTAGTPFGVTGSTVIIEITLTGATGPFTFCLDAAADDSLWTYTDGTWVEVPSTYDAGTGRLCATVDHFSLWAVAGDKTATTTSLASSDASSTYGETVTLTATVTGAAPTGTVDFSEGTTGLGSCTLASGACSIEVSDLALGDHPIVARYGGDAEYAASESDPVTQAVAAATLTVTPDPVTVTYGDPAPATYAFAITGFVLGETSGDAAGYVAPTCDSAYAAGNGVGTYAITCTGGSATNYAFDHTTATLTVTPATLTITADDTTATYGDPSPAFGFTVDGLYGTETLATNPVCTSERTAGSAAGAYAIDCTGGTASANYTTPFTYVAGTLTVGARTLHVTADSTTVTYGSAAPAIGFGVTGFVGDDTWDVPPTCGTTYVPGNGPGTYATSCSGGDAGAGYTLAYAPGTLTVGRRALGSGSVVYTGQLFHYATSSGTVQVALTASITADFDPSLCTVPGGPTVAAAHLHFIDTNTNRILVDNVPISAIDCNNGIATAYATLSSGTNGVQGYHVHAELAGPVSGDNRDQDLTSSTVVVMTGVPTSGVSAYGALGHRDGTSATELGTYGSFHVGSTDPAVITLAVTVSPATKKGSATVKGQIELYIPGTYRPAGGVAIDGTYYVKATAMNSVSRTATGATIFSKAVIQFQPADHSPTIGIDGGAALRVDTIDAALGGATDTVGVTLTSAKTSALYYSNDWYKSGKAWLTRPGTLIGLASFVSVR